MKALKVFLVSFMMLFAFQLSSQTVYNWFQLNSGTSNSLNYINQNWIAGNGGKILYSTSAGVNWSSITSPVSTDLKAVSNTGSTVVIAGSSGVIIKSTNSGADWQQGVTGITSNLNFVTRNGGANYIAAGDGGVILYSSSSGTQWQQGISGTTVNLNSVYGLATSGWAVGDNGIILNTTNWGANWSQQTSGVTDKLNSVEFSSFTNGFIAGNNGKLLSTTNGGASWQQVNSGTTQHLNSVRISGSLVFAAGNNGVVIFSTNSGASWSQVSGSGLPSFSIKSIVVLNANELVVTGENGAIFKRRADPLFFPYAPLEGNDIRASFISKGVFNQDVRTNNTPGFEWPKNSGKFAIFTSGLTIGAYVNNSIRMAAASYNGEYKSGYVSNGVFATDDRFRIYKVKRGDTYLTNQNWNEWGNMVPYGAPYTDVNGNGAFDPQADIPGVKDASETIFMCITDADPSSHTTSEGFGGGTAPLFAQVHLTAWSYDNAGMDRVQFMKWVIHNKGTQPWDSTIFSIVSDPDLGDATDDYMGCDTLLNTGYCYNADNTDGDGSGVTYGNPPPAVGQMFLNCGGSNARLTSMTGFRGTGALGPVCERDASNTIEAYRYMTGVKKDLTPWVVPNTNPPQITKYVYTGIPGGQGWSEFTGRIENCGGSLTGPLVSPCPVGDRKMVLSYKPQVNRINPGDSQVVLAAQFIGRGSSNLNSVSVLLDMADDIKTFCQNGFVIGISPISTNVPSSYRLQQNFPNPFNPVTKINFDIPKQGFTSVKIYDALGRLISTVVNENLKAGEYSVEWNASAYPSGVYFYSMQTQSFTETKKMVLVK